MKRRSIPTGPVLCFIILAAGSVVAGGFPCQDQRESGRQKETEGFGSFAALKASALPMREIDRLADTSAFGGNQAFTAPLADLPCFQATKMDAAGVYSPIRERFGVMVLFAGVLLFSLTAIGWCLWRWQRVLCRQKYQNLLLRAQQEASLDGILTVDDGGNVILYNRRFREIWNIPPEEIAPKRDEVLRESIRNLLADPDGFQERVRCLYDNCRETSQDDITLNDGRIIGRYSAPMHGPDDRYVGRVWRFRDITEQRRSEALLRESERRITTMFNQSPLGMAFIDAPTGQIQEANPMFAKIVGRTLEQMANVNWMSLVHPDDTREILDSVALLNTGKMPGFQMEKRYLHHDGTTVWIQMTIAMLHVEGKAQRSYLCMVKDITKRKQAEDSLLNAKAELQQHAATLESSNHALEAYARLAEAASRAKSAFLANMSHEIRTPMTAILGYTDLLLNEKELGHAPEYRRQSLEIIKRNGEHLLGLINDILDLSKVEAGQMQIEAVSCSPVQLMTEVVSLMRVRAEAKQLRFRADLVSPMPTTMLTDPLRLRQVLVNLVGNAIKFTDQGEIRIVARLTSDIGRPRLCFDVTDTGIGISGEDLKNLFRPFTQVDSSSARRFGGAGLGLCISKQLAEALGGRIEVCSEPGKGSTFSLTIDPGSLDGIPMIEKIPDVLFDRPPTTAASDSGKIELRGTVLLAEDCPDSQRLISLLLRKAGAEVTLAENGQVAYDEALAARARGTPFDIILMDIQMPIIDGYEATRRLRTQNYTDPIIALTAHAMVEDCQKCLDAGCDDYATKPIDRQRLLATVAHWLTCGRKNDKPAKLKTGDGIAHTCVKIEKA